MSTPRDGGRGRATPQRSGTLATTGRGPLRPPASRHRARRLLAVVLTLVIVVGVFLGGRAVLAAFPDGAGVRAEKTSPPKPAETASGPPAECAARNLEITASTPRDSYVVGESVPITVTVRHTGSRPCLVDGSEVGRPVVVTSGKERVWSSADCGGKERMLLMGRGDVDNATVVWNAKRSGSGCPVGGPDVGQGTYKVVARLAGVVDAVSKPLVLTIGADTSE